MTLVLPSLLALMLASAAPNAAADLEQAHDLWQTGRYAEAEERYRELKNSGADPVAVALGLSRCRESTGR